MYREECQWDVDFCYYQPTFWEARKRCRLDESMSPSHQRWEQERVASKFQGWDRLLHTTH
jgi:hypothetical protein